MLFDEGIYMFFTPVVIVLAIICVFGVGYGIFRLVDKPSLPPKPRDKKLADKHDDLVEDAEIDSSKSDVNDISDLEAIKKSDKLEKERASQEAVKEGFFRRLVQGLSKTKSHLVERIDQAVRGKKQIDDELYEELESILITSDVGIKTAQKLLEQIRARAERAELQDLSSLRNYLQDDIRAIFSKANSNIKTPDINLSSQKPYVILIVGVNGVGKTTTIGKLASRYQLEGKKVMLAAGDTFRAAAIDQLQIWGERANVPVIHNKEGSDPSAVIYDGVQAAIAKNMDILIADTAGRLHTKNNLMEELKKVTRVISKAMPGAPHEVWLILDATMGQNALSQATIFHEGCHLTGLVVTKLDGTAKGGAIIGIVDALNLPVRYIGVGEKIEDLQPFDGNSFVDALF